MELTLLYDGGCPLCVREVNLLEKRDRARNGKQPKLTFVDIDQAEYDPDNYAGITYREAMGRIHAISSNGEVLHDVAVFRQAYALIGLGWLYAPTRWPGVRQLADGAYGLWAAGRLRVTGRPDLETLCRTHEGTSAASSSTPK